MIPEISERKPIEQFPDELEMLSALEEYYLGFSQGSLDSMASAFRRHGLNAARGFQYLFHGFHGESIGAPDEPDEARTFLDRVRKYRSSLGQE